MKRYGVVMAGGGGTRFWPLSRQALPKQLLSLNGKELMINETIHRIQKAIALDDIFVVTGQNQSNEMASALEGEIRLDHMLLEPSARNTAACIGYAAFEILKKYGDGIMCVFPSDHYIGNTDHFLKTLETAIAAAEEQDRLVTIGIQPEYPATGYGYIQYDKNETSPVKKVLSFREKPDAVTAKRYLESGSYLWNSGMFIWKATTIIDSYQKLLPSVYDYLTRIAEAMGTPHEDETIREVYPRMPSISIDYGILEHAEDVLVVPGNFIWNDVGSWDNLGVFHQEDENGNIVNGHLVQIDTSNCICYAKDKLIATIGIENLVIVEAGDALLVCDRNRVQEVKKIVERLEQEGKKEYL